MSVMDVSNMVIRIANGIAGKEPKYIAGLICTVIFIILFTFITYHILTIDKDDSNNIVHDDNEEKVNKEFWDKLKEQEDKYTSGTTDRYNWKQNDGEIDVHIPIDGNVLAKDIKVTFKSNNTISINIDSMKFNMIGETHLDIMISECVWQIDNNDDKKYLWITIAKKRLTKQQDYWPGVFKSDIDYTVKAKPSIYNIDNDDPSSLKEAIKSLKTKLKDNKKDK